MNGFFLLPLYNGQFKKFPIYQVSRELKGCHRFAKKQTNQPMDEEIFRSENKIEKKIKKTTFLSDLKAKPGDIRAYTSRIPNKKL